MDDFPAPVAPNQKQWFAPLLPQKKHHAKQTREDYRQTKRP